jgi:hypothetical protein
LLNGNIPKEVTKLTQLLSTMGRFMIFTHYVLWFLIDLGFEITDCEQMEIFYSMDEKNYGKFITTFMQETINAKKAGKKSWSNVSKSF